MFNLLLLNYITSIYLIPFSYVGLRKLNYEIDQLETSLRIMNMKLNELEHLMTELGLEIKGELEDIQLRCHKFQLEETFKK